MRQNESIRITIALSIEPFRIECDRPPLYAMPLPGHVFGPCLPPPPRKLVFNNLNIPISNLSMKGL